MNKIDETLLQVASLYFANCFLWDHFSNPQLTPYLENFNYSMGDGKSPNIEFNSNLIANFLQNHASAIKLNFSAANDNLFKINTHFIRTKALNNCFELLLNYKEGLESKKKKEVGDFLFKQDWMKVLNILRDNAAHMDNYGREFGKHMTWKYKDDEIIKWQNIEIKKSDLGHLISYGDRDAIELINECANFIHNNRDLLE